MGRKIPGKKHKGVKDPQRQRSKRLNSLKGKINAPPSNPDDQEVPHSVTRIAEYKERLNNKQSKPSFAQNKPQRKPLKKKDRFAFKQAKGETNRLFIQRVNRACDAVLQEKAFENKYSVDIKRNPTTGEVEKLVKRPKDELDELVKEARQKGKKRKVKKTTEPTLTKSQKRQKKIKEKKQKKLVAAPFEQPHDVVKFGEVVHEPPSLNAPRKAAKTDGAARPGERNLLLKSVMQNNNVIESKKSSRSEIMLGKTTNKAIDKSGKRKNLPHATRRRLEKQQAEVIDAYRQLKKQRNPTSTFA